MTDSNIVENPIPLVLPLKIDQIPNEYDSIDYPMSILSDINLNAPIPKYFPTDSICVPINLSCPMKSIKVQGLPLGIEFQLGFLGIEAEKEIKIRKFDPISVNGYLTMDNDYFVKLIASNPVYQSNMKKYNGKFAQFGSSQFLIFNREEIIKTKYDNLSIVITVQICNVLEKRQINNVYRSSWKFRPINSKELKYDDETNVLYDDPDQTELISSAENKLHQLTNRNKCLGCSILRSSIENTNNLAKLVCMCHHGHFVCLECFNQQPDIFHWRHKFGPEHSICVH